MVETAGNAHFITNHRQDPAHSALLLSSDRKTDALLLASFIQTNPQDALIPKLVQGLMAHMKKGRWNNTQENVFALLALRHYFQAYEKKAPNMVAQWWLGNEGLGKQAFIGHTAKDYHQHVPMAWLQEKTQRASENFIINKRGEGRLYYRLGMRYAPIQRALQPLDHGFEVHRTYAGVDDPSAVRQDAQGVWHIRAGATVRVIIHLINPTRRYQVALVDSLPAGFEIINPALAVNAPEEDLPLEINPLAGRRPFARYRIGYRPVWFEHQNLRDSRAEAFASILWEGAHRYSYVARASTTGTFTAPPAKAEEMYSPEIFGRSASAVVVVK